ncbi:hypothetical protein [Streptomyces sp. NPDC050564]|uniref:hypothetical protein n=1 Tax=Streptomyces sp. NPDC050564 TaxID=3365631 RepID=UPI0037A09790
MTVGKSLTMGKSLATFALVGGALAGGIAFASPAAAVSSCSDAFAHQFNIVFPGQKPETTYYIENCADVTSGKMTASSNVTWNIVDDQVIDNSKRFTSFKITTRVESRTDSGGSDTIVASKTCDWTALFNNDYSGPGEPGPASTCTVPSVTYNKDLYWSSDSTVVYDIEGDGKGAITKELYGSPLMHG